MEVAAQERKAAHPMEEEATQHMEVAIRHMVVAVLAMLVAAHLIMATRIDLNGSSLS